MTPYLPNLILPINFAFFSRGHLANSAEYNIPGIIFPSNSQTSSAQTGSSAPPLSSCVTQFFPGAPLCDIPVQGMREVKWCWFGGGNGGVGGVREAPFLAQLKL